MAATEVFAGIAVADYPAARAWYERLLGRPPDMLPNDNEATWKLTDSGWIYVVEDAERAGTALVTILVDDLDGLVAGLQGRGVTAELDEVPEVVRKAAVTDPEGNRVTFAQPGA